VPAGAKPFYCIEAPDQQRLKTARIEIEAVLKKYDIAGVVFLHTPGMVEFFHDIRPSYSCAGLSDAPPAFWINCSLWSDFGGDIKRQLFVRRATGNMLSSIAESLAHAGLMFLDVAKIADEKLQLDHTPLRPVADPAEGNPQ
jgi:hypothetical protein